MGTPFDARNVITIFKSLLEQAGVKTMRWHGLRHSCANDRALADGTTW
jgi:hypothetical protein